MLDKNERVARQELFQEAWSGSRLHERTLQHSFKVSGCSHYFLLSESGEVDNCHKQSPLPEVWIAATRRSSCFVAVISFYLAWWWPMFRGLSVSAGVKDWFQNKGRAGQLMPPCLENLVG